MRMMSSSSPPSFELGERDREILEFERSHWGSIPNKESAVREHLGLSVARYYQRVYAICALPEAVEYDAVLVRNIQEAARLRQTATRSLGEESR
jgi:hypothetical protein